MPAIKQLLVILLLGVVAFSCGKPDHTQPDAAAGNSVQTSAEAASDDATQPAVIKEDEPTVITYATNPKALLTNFESWYKYHYTTIKLAQDFVGLDVDSSIISKDKFLSRLATGNFIALKVLKKDKIPYYKLAKFTSADPSIKQVVQQLASIEIKNFKMEGHKLPDYHFTDLKGKEYSNLTTKGKVVVLKCWFIHCTACVAEFPKLNQLVEDNKNRNDISFVSLASDSKNDLTTFLEKKEFKYAVIPNEEDYMTNQLQVMMYPTHILVDKDGKIRKVSNAIEDLIPFIPQ